ncbi:MAG: hypothetical protein MR644_00935 [Megasphaera elsdenii]|jgi:hypothetical protein|nr:hypothetical protein [Megasphaera elsdenii]
MPLEKETRDRIYNYCNNHLSDEEYCNKLFDFILDEALKTVIVKRYKALRFSYKLFEGIEAKDEILEFEIQSQIIGYASIYEAIFTYVLKEFYHETLQKNGHDISFRKKCKIAKKHNLIRDFNKKPQYKLDDVNNLFDELAKFYETRNQIHIYCELKRNNQLDLNMSKVAYWRIEAVTQQIKDQLTEEGKYQV